MIWLLVLVAGAAVYGVAKTAHGRIRAHGFLVLAWRLLTGHPWHGKAITDRGWLRPGTRALTRTGHAPRAYYLPRWKHALRRAGPASVAVFTVYGLAVARTATLALLAVAAAVALAFGAWTVRQRLQQRKHRRAWISPLHMALAGEMKVPVAAAPKYLAIEPDRSKVTLTLPQEFDGDAKAKERITRIVSTKLALDSPDASWQLHGPHPYVTFTRSVPPPPKAVLADLREAIAKAGPDDIVLGVGTRSAVVSASLDQDSPHVGMSIGTGGGKSTIARMIAMQVLRRGGFVPILDYKMTSHAWARGLPNVAYADTIERIYRLLMWLEEEMERRNAVAAAGTDIEGRLHANVGARMLILAEEMNATMTKLRRWWARLRQEDKSLPPRCPAIDAYENLHFMGRSTRMNMLDIAQKLSSRATGSGDARENMGIRMLGRATANNWKALVDDFPYPGRTSAPGRVHVVTAECREVQIGFVTGAQAREMALSGAVARPPQGMPCTDHRPVRSTGAPQLAKTVPGQGFSIMNGGPVNSPDAGVTLREAADAGTTRYRLATLRTYRSIDRENFPDPVGKRGLDDLYDPEQLAAYAGPGSRDRASA